MNHKIEIQQFIGHSMTVNGKVYSRYAPNSWFERFGESDEPVNWPDENDRLEALFQREIQTTNYMPDVEKLLTKADSDLITHTMVAALPGIIGHAILAYEDCKGNPGTPEQKVAYVMNVIAAKILRIVS